MPSRLRADDIVIAAYFSRRCLIRRRCHPYYFDAIIYYTLPSDILFAAIYWLLMPLSLRLFIIFSHWRWFLYAIIHYIRFIFHLRWVFDEIWCLFDSLPPDITLFIALITHAAGYHWRWLLIIFFSWCHTPLPYIDTLILIIVSSRYLILALSRYDAIIYAEMLLYCRRRLMPEVYAHFDMLDDRCL